MISYYMWKVRIGTIFPSIFPGPLGVSCIGKALGSKWNLKVDDLRQFGIGKHKTIDDTPCSGGAGMLMRADVIDEWLNSTKSDLINYKYIYMSPRGSVLNSNMSKILTQKPLCILCGRFEGVDARVLTHWNIEEISIGDFILCGGEVAALALLESCVRLLPSVLGNAKSIQTESFVQNLLEHDQYTKPIKWVPKCSKSSYNVPEVLLSGNHGKIEKWKLLNQQSITESRRPDLWSKYNRRKNGLASDV